MFCNNSMTLDISATPFYEKINLTKLKYIVEHRSEFEDRIKEEEKDMRRDDHYNAFAVFKKIIKIAIPIKNSEHGYIPVRYRKGLKSDGIGRWYADKSIGLAPMCLSVRHTICQGLWVDIDQVNSHPSIMKVFMDKYNYNSPLLNENISDRNSSLTKIMKEENCVISKQGETKKQCLNNITEGNLCCRDCAKQHLISAINGKKYKSKTLKTLIDEIKPCINHLMELPEHQYILDYCKKEYGDKHHNLSGKVISRILQVVENDLLEVYLKFCMERNLISRFKDGLQVSLIFDGFQIPVHKDITDQLLDDMRLYAFQETGYDLPLKIKEFDNPLSLPDDYLETNSDKDEPDIDDDYPATRFYDKVKKEFEQYTCKILYPPMIIHTGDLDVQPQSIKSAKETHSHLTCKKIRKKKNSNEKETCLEQFFEIWLKDPTIRHYIKEVWKPPPLTCDNKYYNTWKPFKILEQDLIETDRNYWEEFLTYSHNLFADEKVANYILARYAFRIQNPGLRSYVCVVYFGEEGDGKSKFLEVLYAIFGKNAIMVDSANKIFEKHAGVEEEKIFVLVPEAGGKTNFENVDNLKTRISEDTLPVNPKGMPLKIIDNLADYDNTTNNLNVVKLSDSSKRRFFQCSTTTYYNGNTEFFTDMVNNIIPNPVALRQIYEGLSKFDWKAIVPSGNFQDERYKPETAIMKEVKASNRDKVVYWLADCIDKSKDKIMIKGKNQEIFDEWNYWCERNKVKIEYNSIQFGIKMKSISKNIKLKTGEEGIVKDTSNNTTTIYTNIIRTYLNKLDSTMYAFVDDDADSQADTEESINASNSEVNEPPLPPLQPQKRKKPK